MDAQVLPNGNVLVTEQSGRLLTERTLKNEIVWQRAVNGIATGVRRLPNGNIFISARATSCLRSTKDGRTCGRSTATTRTSSARDVFPPAAP